jgi:prepilin-type N-terminal cleavage/methylation domain-containing protein
VWGSIMASRKALTLMEVIVVLAVLGVVCAMIIPAIMRVRAIAEVLSCANNLRQIGSGIQTYAAHNNLHLPAGCSDTGDGERFPHLSWLARLLPYVEEDSLWAATRVAFERDRFFLSDPHHAVFSRVIKPFTCPSDPRISVFQVIPNVLGGNMRMAFTSYLGVSGISQRQNNGVMFKNSRIRFSDIHDGLGHTLLAGERPPSAWLNAGWWYAGWGMDKNGAGDTVLGVQEINSYPMNYPRPNDFPAGPFEFAPGDMDQQVSMFHFWSLHSQGAHFLFADSSVRFLRYSAKTILPGLSTRAGNERMSRFPLINE